MIKWILAALLCVSSAFAQNRLVSLGTANTVNIRGEIDESSMAVASKELLHLNKVRGDKDYPIFIVLDSPGGSISDGEDFIEIAKTIENVHTITLFAASMASAIVEALPGERLILDNGTMMFHRASGGVRGQFETGELESRLEFYKKYVRRMEKRNANRMKMPLKEYKKRVKDEMWLTAEDSVAQLASDEIVSIKCSDALQNKIETKTLQVFIFSLQVEQSACPLLKAMTPVKDADQSVVALWNRTKGMSNGKN